MIRFVARRQQKNVGRDTIPPNNNMVSQRRPRFARKSTCAVRAIKPSYARRIRIIKVAADIPPQTFVGRRCACPTYEL